MLREPAKCKIIELFYSTEQKIFCHSVCTSICLSVYSSTSTYSLICISVCFLPICLCARSSVNLLVHLSIFLYVNPFFIPKSVRLSIPIYLSICLTISICLLFNPSIYSSLSVFHPFVCLFIPICFSLSVCPNCTPFH